VSISELPTESVALDRTTIPQPRRWERRDVVLVFAVVGFVVLAQGINMLHYPYLENDEGTYVAQAWAVLHEGRLAPYTYFYDHAPGGWLQIAAWQLLTGGVNGWFGEAIASGRFFMLLLQAVSTVLVIAAGRKLTGKLWVGLLAALLFGLSPGGLPYHRRVLLDNIATVWMLASFVLLLSRPLRLNRAWLSAMALGVGFWSKEIAVALIPALAVLAARQTPRHTRLLATAGWLTVCLSLISVYPLMALLKGELFPTGSLLGGTRPHVSLVCSLKWQSSRGTDGGITNPGSAFWETMGHWAVHDPLLILGGTTAAAVCIVWSRREPALAMLGWVVVSFWLFLGRGGLILDFYVVPILPFLALGVAVLLSRISAAAGAITPSHRTAFTTGLAGGLSLVCLGALAYQLVQPGNRLIWQASPVTGQERAVSWAERHIPPDNTIVIDMYMWVDLHDPGSLSQQPFTLAHFYWKVAEDPAIRDGVFHDNWRKIDYIITTPQLVQDTQLQGFPIIRAALDHSRSVASFNTGWAVDIRKVDPTLKTSQFVWKAPNTTPDPSCMTSG
jgi:hypothetical protein